MMTKQQREELEAIAALPDDQIDFSDIPELTEEQSKQGVRGMFRRPESKLVSIRLNSADLALATKLAIRKGLPYQTYIKSLLHESLVRENQKEAY
jgi:predicted DNA binding CopG/RHH family protein